MKVARLLIAAALLAGPTVAEAKYFPRYAGPDGGIIDFTTKGFRITYFDDQGDYSYTCEMLGSLTPTMHWARCKGGEKFFYTLDPKNPLTMKIGEVSYTECSKLDDC
ncbi:hypothetical protein [Shinella sp.]|uniref:hypothetical protein n=1 Tax=Shinella sp. TaxID=1870904 RepID=UPI0029B10AC5|nr:hypothetical protein [Shinella sp.]MDX3977004.1 hypothetical protein [Shinella sp.]